MKKGIDVSSHQKIINWDIVKDQIDFAIIRCGFGNNITSQDDTYWKRNADECTRLGIPFGVYLYSYAVNLDQAQSEVEHTLRLIKDYKLEYPVFLDVEDKTQMALPTNDLLNIVKHYCDALENNGYYVGIYANLSTFNGKLNSSILDSYDKWVAQWSSEFNYKKPAGMWQNTSSAKINGIETNVDADIAFYDYPEIIKNAGLNHFEKPIKPTPEPPIDPEPEKPEEPKETINLKYQVDDILYLKGPLYKTQDGIEILEEYHNQKVVVTNTNDEIGVVAPYQIDTNGYAKEDDLHTTRNLTLKDICAIIWTFIKRLLCKK